MRVHTSLNDYSLWTFITRPSIEYKDDTSLLRGIYSITQGMALTWTEPQYGWPYHLLQWEISTSNTTFV